MFRLGNCSRPVDQSGALHVSCASFAAFPWYFESTDSRGLLVAVLAPINPDTVRWARGVSGWDLGDLARRLNVTPGRLLAWESGEAVPTVNQLRNLAEVFDRTMASFFVAPPVNSGVPETPDFRGLGSEPLGHLAVRELRRVEEYRERFIELSDVELPRVELEPFSWDSLARRAQDLRDALGVPDPFKGPRKLTDWVSLVEGLGVLVFQSTRVPTTDFRGVSVHHDYAPVILMNGSDTERAKVFTLFHEMAHLANRSSALCLERESVKAEVLYNRFAGEFLMPERLVARVVEESDPHDVIALVARRFGTSEFSSAIRLLHLGVVTQDEVDRVEAESDAAWEAEVRRRRSKKGGPGPVVMRRRDLSSQYLHAVIDAVDDHRIDLLDASYFLNTKVPTVLGLRHAVLTEAV